MYTITLDLTRVSRKTPAFIVDAALSAYHSDTDVMEGNVGELFTDLEDYSRTRKYQDQVARLLLLLRATLKAVARAFHEEFEMMTIHHLVLRIGTLYTFYFT